MKKLMLSLLFILGTCASQANPAQANPFDVFAGNYTVDSAPQIQHNGSAAQCVWMNFKGIQSINLMVDANGVYQFTLNSVLDGSPVSSTSAFKEYRNNGPFAVVNSGAVSGGSNLATYEQINSTISSRETLNIVFTKTASGFALMMSDQKMENDTPSACYYNVGLRKQ
jgi:hypothetical protein